MGRDGEGDKIEVKGWKGRGKDLPDQCQTASYAPVPPRRTFTLVLVFLRLFVFQLRYRQTDRQTDGRTDRQDALCGLLGQPHVSSGFCIQIYVLKCVILFCNVSYCICAINVLLVNDN